MGPRAVALLACTMLTCISTPPAVAAPICDVTGTWSDNFGTTYLRMSAAGSVSGNYTWENGTLVGILDGAFLNGTWKEEPSFAAPRDAGTFSWQFSADCSSFSGTYSYAESPLGTAGSWYGTRTSNETPGLGPLDPLPQELQRPACDPGGEWTTNLDNVNFFGLDRSSLPATMQGHFYTAGRAQVGELTGNMTGLTYEGHWRNPAAQSTGAFAITFDNDCGGFRGRWVGSDSTGPAEWVGQRIKAFAPGTASPPPTPDAAAPTPEPDPVDRAIDDAVEADANEGDPLGVPTPSAALVLLAIAAAAALGLRRRDR